MKGITDLPLSQLSRRPIEHTLVFEICQQKQGSVTDNLQTRGEQSIWNNDLQVQWRLSSQVFDAQGNRANTHPPAI